MKKYIATQKEIDILINNYVNKKWGLLKSGAELGLGKKVVKRILQENGIKIRDNAEAHRVYQINDSYFDKESHNMAYILGFLASDGNISTKDNKIKIGLSAVDKEILEKIKEELQSTRPLYEYTTTQGYNVAELTFNSAHIKKKLAEYGIVPNKTFTLQPPIKLDEQYIIDYIRGYFDGDGSICKTGYLNHGKEFRIVSASKEILEFFEDYFYKNYGQSKGHIYPRSKVEGRAQLYDLKYSTNFTKKLYNILYTPNSLYLKRKKDKYEQLLLI